VALPNGLKVRLDTPILFEMKSLADANPRLLSSCKVMYFELPSVHSVLEFERKSLLERFKNVDSRNLSSAIDEVYGSIFLKESAPK